MERVWWLQISSFPAGGANSAPQNPLAGISWATSKRGKERGKGEKEGEKEKSERKRYLRDGEKHPTLPK